MDALEIENATLQEQNKTLLEKLQHEQKKVEQLYKDAEDTRVVLQKEIEESKPKMNDEMLILACDGLWLPQYSTT